MNALFPRLSFTFDERRTVQACAVLIRAGAEGERENYTKLLKLLYLADRRSLLDTGAPITGSSFVSMKHGPVLSQVYDCIKGDPSGSTWDQHIARDNFDVVLVKDPGDSELSDYDEEVLTDLAKKHRNDDYLRMIEIVHKLPEWHDPSPSKVEVLLPSEILAADKQPPEAIAGLAKEAAYREGVGRLLRRRA